MSIAVADNAGDAPQAPPVPQIKDIQARYQSALASLTPEQWWAVELMMLAQTMATFPLESARIRLLGLLQRQARGASEGIFRH